MGGASAGAQEVQEWAGRDWGMFWAFWALEDRGWDQRKDMGRFRAGGHPSLAAGGCVPAGPRMINEAGFWSSSCADVEGREHLAPPACVAAWPLREALALSRVLCDPPPTSPSQGWRMEGAGWGEPGQGGHPQHLHHRSETCLEPWLDKYFFAKDTQGVTLSICYPLCSATGESLASLFQGAGWSLGMDTGALLGGSLGREQVFPSVRMAWLQVKVVLFTCQLSRGSQYISLKMSFPSPGGLSPPAPEPQGWW